MDSYDFIVEAVERFRARWSLLWSDMVLVTAGDVLTSLAEHKVLYAGIDPDYAVFEPSDAALADALAAEFAQKGVTVFADKRFGNKVYLYVFALQTKAPETQWQQLENFWQSPLTNRKVLDSAALPGEMTPFIFKGGEYRVENVMQHFLTGELEEGVPRESHFRIRRVADDRIISIPLRGHYFGTAFVWNDVCYCFSLDLEGRESWASSRVIMIKSDDLEHWSDPVCVWDVTGDGEKIFNNSITFDGRRFVLLYENNDPRYPIYTLKFAESDDLIHWRKVENALYGPDKYTGGPSLYWIGEDHYYYLTYVDMFVHPISRKLAYRTSVSRSKDLVKWEDAPAGRHVLLPDFSRVTDPAGHPGVYELNNSDAEYLEKDGVVRAYFCGGNQCGVTDNQTAEFHGTLAEFFRAFYM